MPRINPKNLTVDFSLLQKLSMSDRIAMLKSERGRNYLSSLTPVQYAMLFPDYFRRGLPDLGKTATPTKLGFFDRMRRAITGGPSYGGAAPSAPARPGTAAPSAPASTKASTPAASSVTKFGWEEKLAELSGGAKTQKSNIGGFELSDTTSVGPASINSKGYVNKEEFYKQAVKTFRNSPLNEFVPKDGEKYGIKNGTAEEWANLAMRTASVESSFRVTTTNLKDEGGSFGLFQFGYHYGITKENWKNPQAQLDAFVKYSSIWVKNGGGYILPPSDIKGVKRYQGHGGFGAAFSTFRNNKVNSESAWSVSNNIQGNIGRAQQQSQSQQARVEGPRERVLGKDKPPLVASDYMSIANERLKNFPESFKKQLEGLPEDQRNKFFQQIASIPDDKLPEFSKHLQSLPVPEQRKIIPQINESAPGEIPNFKIWQEGEKAGTVPTSRERERVFREGGVVVNLDTNWSERGNQTGPEVIIPDEATPEQRKAAEDYVREVERVYREKFGKSLPGKVLTRSENKARQPNRPKFSGGRTATIHTEPFSVNDDKAVDYFFKDPEGSKILAQIEAKTLGKIPGVQFSEPHNRYAKKKDVGAVSDRDPNISEVNIADQRLRLLQSMRDAAQQTAQSQPQQTAPNPPSAQQQNPAGTQSQTATVIPPRPPPTSSYRLTGAAAYLPQNTIRQYLPAGAELSRDGSTVTIPSDSLDTYLKDPKIQESLQTSGITPDQLKGYLESVQAAPAAPAEESKKLYAGGTIRGLSTGGTERTESGPDSESVADFGEERGRPVKVTQESTSGIAPTPSGDTQPLIGPDGNPIAMINPKSESVITEPATGQTTIVPVQREAHEIIEPKQDKERNDYAEKEAVKQMADLENSIMEKMRKEFQNQEPLPTNNPQLAEMHHSYTENAFSFSNSFIRALGIAYAKNIRGKDPKNLAFGRTDIA